MILKIFLLSTPKQTIWLVYLCHCSGLPSRICWWGWGFSPSWDMRVNFPGFVCWHLGWKASCCSEVGLQWGWPWRDVKLMIASWPFWGSSERRWEDGLRLMLSWMVGGKGCGGVLSCRLGWVTAACKAKGELRQSLRLALTGRAGATCCRQGLGYSFRWAFFPLLSWVTWG